MKVRRGVFAAYVTISDSQAIGDCHAAVHKMGCERIAVRPSVTRALKCTDGPTDIRIGTRTDKEITSGGNLGKVARVEQILGSAGTQEKSS